MRIFAALGLDNFDIRMKRLRFILISKLNTHACSLTMECNRLAVRRHKRLTERFRTTIYFLKLNLFFPAEILTTSCQFVGNHFVWY
jgi:hypothetical protein